MKKFLFSALALMVLAHPVVRADEPAKEFALKVAQAQGLDAFSSVKEIRFTFNVEVGGERKAKRAWVWEPQADRVTLARDGQEPLVYVRKEVGANAPEEVAKADQNFINDTYWLLFPLHLAWDTSAKLTLDPEPVEPPMGGEPARRLTVNYTDAGGYTPGDVYELFVDDQMQPMEWIFRKGGQEKPTLVTTWEQGEKFGPLTIFLEHKNPEGFHLFMTDVAVK